ncbi:hypothetical protein [Ensifer sp. SL37]|uniref:hypothetical protein n=1 Tax=Ensifer sp. SL37 TaxID=2995137 RepID=UPI00227253CA|nr:hypothetical protein [Ensifer sp. SL37]MCY1740673.1 hypothetical protein [Ensifer sp. SL37]
MTNSHGFVTEPLRRYYEGLDASGKKELLRHQLYLTQTTFGSAAKRILAVGDLKQKYLQDDAATKLSSNTPERQKFLAARRQMTLDVLQPILKKNEGSEIVAVTVKAARDALLSHEDPDFPADSDLASLNALQRNVIERVEDHDSAVGDDADAADAADIQEALSKFFAQSPLSPRDADAITTGGKVRTQAFGEVDYLPYLLAFNDKEGPFRRAYPSDTAQNAAYQIAFDSKELQGFRSEVRAMSDRPSEEGGTLEARRDYWNETAPPSPVSGFETEPYINSELQKIDPDLFAVTKFTGYQSSEHFTQKTLNRWYLVLGMSAQQSFKQAVQTTTPNMQFSGQDSKFIWENDIGFFRRALSQELPDEPSEFLDSNNRYDPIFSDGAPVFRAYSYRAQNGDLFVYSPWAPGQQERQRRSLPSQLVKIKEVPGKQEYSDNEILSYLNSSLQIRGGDGVIVIPQIKQATAASIAQKRAQLISPLGKNKTLDKILDLDLSPDHAQDVDQFFQKNKEELAANVGQSLDAIPLFTTIAGNGELSSTEHKRVQVYVYEFLDGKRKALKGSAAGVFNPDILYLPTGDDEQFSGILINLNQGKTAAIPKGLKEQLSVFKSDEFRAMFAEGIDDKTKGEMALKLKALANSNNAKHLANPGDYLKALEARGGKFYLKTSDDGRLGGAPVSRTREVGEADNLANNLSDYIMFTASGLITPSDEDISSIDRIADILSAAPSKSEIKNQLVDFSRTLHLNKVSDAASQSIDDLKSANRNPIILDQMAMLHNEWGYNNTSAWEETVQDGVKALRPALQAVGYGLSIGLSIAFPGVLPGVLAGVAVTAVTDIAVDAAELSVTDDLEKSDRLARGITEKFFKSIGTEILLEGSIAAITGLAKKAIGGLVRSSAPPIKGLEQSAHIAKVIKNVEAAVDKHVKNSALGKTSKTAPSAAGKPASNRSTSSIGIDPETAELLIECVDGRVPQAVWGNVYKYLVMQAVASNPDEEGFSGDVGALLQGVQTKIAAEAAKSGGRIGQEQAQEIIEAGNSIDKSHMIEELVEAGVVRKNKDGSIASLINDQAAFNSAETTSPNELEGQPVSSSSRRSSGDILRDVAVNLSGLKYGLGIGEPESLITSTHVNTWKAGFRDWKPTQLQEVADALDDLRGKNLDTSDAQALLVKLGEKLHALPIPADPSSQAFQEKSRLLTVIDWNKALSAEEVGDYVAANSASLLPVVAEGDLANPLVRLMREKILMQTMVEEGYSKNRLSTSEGLSRRGTSYDDRQWTGLHLAKQATAALGGPIKEYTPANSGSNITTNHYIIDHGNTWIDPTWKQFFSEAETLGKPPFFTGTVANFRAMGLDRDRTENYLKLIRKQATVRSVPRAG